MVVSVTERGEVETEKRFIISNELRWPVIINMVVPEGTRVKPGDVIIKFECAELIEAIEDLRILLTKSRQDYEQASKNVELTRKERANQVHKAGQTVTDAAKAVSRYIEGEWPIKHGQALNNINIAERDLALAQDKLDFKLKANRELAEHAPYSDNEIKADKLNVDRLKFALKKARSELVMLDKYDHPAEKRKLEMALKQAELELERANLEAKLRVQLAEYESLSKKEILKRRNERLKSLLEDKDKLIVKAKKAGLVVYDTAGNRWNPSSVEVAVGEKINPRQQLMKIPNMETLQIKTRIYEAIIEKVSLGLKAHVRLDAHPGKTISGYVHKVAVLPSRQHSWLNPGVKVFDVIIKLDDEVLRLKPGMTAQVELVLARLENVMSVPIAAVFTEQNKTYCWRVEDGKSKRIQVEVGGMNDARVQIVSGLNEGDTVLLTSPGDGQEAKEKTPAKESGKEPSEEPARTRRPAGRAKGKRQ